MVIHQSKTDNFLLLKTCPLCGDSRLEYEFIVDKTPVCQCKGCSLLFLNPQPCTENSDSISSLDGDLAAPSGTHENHKRNAMFYISRLTHYSAGLVGRLLLVGSNCEYVEQEAKDKGYIVDSVTVRDFKKMLSTAEGRSCHYDGCILFSALERFPDPGIILGKIKDWLKPCGSLMIVYPSLDSWSARLFRSKWWEFRLENLFYFDTNSMQNLLFKAGYGDPIIYSDFRNVSLNYARLRVKTMRKGLARTGLAALLRLAPRMIADFPFRFMDSRKIFFARPQDAKEVRSISVIVPVFNEKPTFAMLMESLLAKKIPDLNMQVIVVESNSTDGSREEVLRYQDHPNVRVILENMPRGKGHAVRTGLSMATGQIVLIQDADLEYDIDDYDALVEPIVKHQQSFVIGSRHVNSKQAWKVREFNDSPVLSWVFNFGHLLFLSLFNFIYRQSLKDPFSMFKVFRRECLYGLSFECNRFDFDFEIVIKLLRKGYRPIELPVNYRARSLQEGKKVSLLRDPFTWLHALIRFRFSPLYGPLKYYDANRDDTTII
jgi:glycosyltransferase involved in cell wall biosynthesis